MNKSKFLKKSLAMLLALMLVVAMIPLSAAAAVQDDLKYITVDGSQVSVDSLTVEVGSDRLEDDDNIVIGTGVDLSPVELWVYENNNSVTHKTADADGENFKISEYVDVSADKTTGTMSLALVDPTSTQDRVLATYTLKITFVDPNTTTNLAVVSNPQSDSTFGDGVYNAYVKVEGDKHYIVVETARHNPIAANPWGTTVQDDEQAKITVRPLDGATIDNSTSDKEIDANAGQSVTVVSQDKQKETTYTVKSVYVDALESFTLTAGETDYEAVIGDANNDDVPDTLTVTLPKSVLVNASNGDPVTSPSAAVSYSVNGNVNAVTNIVITSGKTYNSVPSDGSTSIELYNLANADVKGTVTVTRLGDFAQQYNLVVKTEDSTNTAITYARVNSTEATVGEGTINAVLPQYYNNAETKLEDVDVVLYTEDTVNKITIGTTAAVEATSEVDVPDGEKAWTWNNVIDARKPVTISVYAEDGHFEQYTLTASKSTATNTAEMSAVWMSVGGETRKGIETGENEYTITVPYMTTSLADAKLYATPTAGSTIVYNYNLEATGAYTGTDIVNGQSTGTTVGQTGTLAVTGTSFELTAVSMGDPKVHTTYTVKVVLDTAKKGTVLTGLDFTAQSENTAGPRSATVTKSSDKAIYRAFNDENQFHAYVDQQSNGSVGLANITLDVPKSLTTHKEDYYGANEVKYYNVVTGFDVADGGVAFVVTNEKPNGSSLNYVLDELNAIDPNNGDDVSGDYIGKYVKNSEAATIVVLPEQVARTLITKGLPKDSATAGDGLGGTVVKQASVNYLKTYGTIYNITVDVADPNSESDLETISVGDVSLKVNGHDIEGELPWSYTFESVDELNKAAFDSNGYFLIYSLSDYAAMRVMEGDPTYKAVNSNGDTDGDGQPNDIGNNNVKFAFVRNDDHTVSVYYKDADTSNDYRELSGDKKDEILVRSEQRLGTSTVSQTTYNFDLTWADPSSEAEITSFQLAGQTGTVTNTSETERTITVRVPYGTSLTGLVATFQKSLGANVTIGTTTGLPFISGVTSMNYTSDVVVYVTSEDKTVRNRYTITVEEGISFSDVNSGAWYYDNVMDAAENGYVTGYTDGTFRPLNSITRAEFASMIAKAMDYDSNPEETPSAFPDVAEDFWGKAAINFCAQNGIISGYSDGTFQPNKAITRQEAAAILNNAFDLAEKVGVSTDLFADDARISSWAEIHVYAAKAAGLMKGDAGTNNFRPTSSITRAEAASILMNAKYEGLIK